MSKATIVSAIGEGLYQAELNFNTEVMQFNLERYRMRLDDIDNVDGPAADQALADAEADLVTAADDLQELIKQLSGQPSDELTATLAAIDSDLTNASNVLDQVNTGLLGAAAWVDSSQNALPAGVPVEITDAYATANAALTLAFSSLNDEQNALTPAQTHLGEVQAAIALSPPDLITAQNSLALLRADLVQVSTDHVQASGAINNAHSEIQAARNLLPATPDYDTARADLDSALAEFADISTDHAAAASYEGDAAAKADKAQDLLTPGNEAIRKEVKDAIATLNTARTARTAAQLAVDTLDLEYAGLHRRIADLGAIPVAESRELWCADLTEDLPGGTEVGTMEVPGEFAPYKETVIRPAFAPAHTHLYDRARDGWLTPTAALTPEAYFYNRAMLPGWQVFRPTFRFAVCTAINADRTMDVGLVFPNTSSQQGINVTPRSIPTGSFAEAAAVSFTHVPVQYMDCDIEAFALGDMVVVQFDNQKAENPRVIGFRDHPRACCFGFVTPLGSIGNKSPTYVFTPREGLLYGQLDWKGQTCSQILSWYGLSHRLWQDYAWFSTVIFRKGTLLVQAPPDYYVLGAALTSSTGGGTVDTIIAVLTNTPYSDYANAGAANGGRTKDSLWITPFPPATSEAAWTKLADIEDPAGTTASNPIGLHPWFFDPTGQHATTVYIRVNFAAGTADTYLMDLTFVPGDPPGAFASVSTVQSLVSLATTGDYNFISGTLYFAADYRRDGVQQVAKITGSVHEYGVPADVTTDTYSTESWSFALNEDVQFLSAEGTAYISDAANPVTGETIIPSTISETIRPLLFLDLREEKNRWAYVQLSHEVTATAAYNPELDVQIYGSATRALEIVFETDGSVFQRAPEAYLQEHRGEGPVFHEGLPPAGHQYVFGPENIADSYVIGNFGPAWNEITIGSRAYNFTSDLIYSFSAFEFSDDQQSEGGTRYVSHWPYARPSGLTVDALWLNFITGRDLAEVVDADLTLGLFPLGVA
jgi:hypothetical protein